MFLFYATTGVDITKEIPLQYWILFIAVMSVVLPLARKLLTHLFIPANDNEEAVVWSAMNKKGKGPKF